eukprot:4070071-Ditylum_brightwellii.AAC.1
MQEDFVLMLRDLQELLDRKVTCNYDENRKHNEGVKSGEKMKLEMKDLETKCTPEVGVFGQVKLVKAKSNSVNSAKQLILSTAEGAEGVKTQIAEE